MTRRLVQRILVGIVIPAMVVVLWQVLCQHGVFPSDLLPAPSAICQAFVAMGSNGTLWADVDATCVRLVLGFVFGALAGLVLGALVGFFETVEWLIDPMIQSVRSVPSLAWVPLFILWMGIGEGSKITLIAVGVFFPMYLATMNGIRYVDRKLLEVGQVFDEALYLCNTIVCYARATGACGGGGHSACGQASHPEPGVAGRREAIYLQYFEAAGGQFGIQAESNRTPVHRFVSDRFGTYPVEYNVWRNVNRHGQGTALSGQSARRPKRLAGRSTGVGCHKASGLHGNASYDFTLVLYLGYPRHSRADWIRESAVGELCS